MAPTLTTRPRGLLTSSSLAACFVFKLADLESPINKSAWRTARHYENKNTSWSRRPARVVVLVTRNNNDKRGAASESGDAHTKVTRFLDSLKVSEKNFSASRLRQMLARKKNERAKKLALRRKQKERVRKLVRDLETTEAEIVSLSNEVSGIETAMQKAMDDDEIDVWKKIEKKKKNTVDTEKCFL